MADGLVAVDADKKVLAFNVEAEVLTGVPSDEAIGKSVDDVLDVRDAQGEKVTLPVYKLGAGSVGGVYLMRRIGSPIAVAVTSAVLKDDEDVVFGGVAVVRDMSREHELERMKSEFLQNISHELRTPLTPIKGYAELLSLREMAPEKTKRFAGGILESTERLERIVGLLVDFSAMESGRLAPRSRPVDVGSLVESLAREWGSRSEKHRLIAEVDPGLPRVSGDERLLRRSLEEILDNAIKFSPEGGTIRLEAYSPPSPTRDAVVEVAVSDEGIGISSEELPYVFADFRQADSSETRTYGGLGLGLAFVQRIVDAHRGEVAVESDQAHGTRLTIRLPAARSGGDAA
jgi:two-component system sensor histidine kinase VicK